MRRKAPIVRSFFGTHHDMKAEIKNRGFSQKAIADLYEVDPQIISHAIVGPYPRGEAILAGFFALPVEQLWPDRYPQDDNESDDSEPNACSASQNKLRKTGCEAAA